MGRLATTIALDVAGYSALTEVDETHATSCCRGRARGIVEATKAKHRRRLFNAAGCTNST